MPVTESSVLEYLETHPDEGSLLAYVDALNHFNIENAVIRINQEDLITLPTPFIAFSQIHGGTFSVVKNLTVNTIEWFDTQNGWVKDKLEEFTKTWSGVVLLAEIDEKSGEKNYTSKRRNEILSNIRIPIAVSIIVFIFLYFILQAPFADINTYILLGLKVIGMVISTLLFVKSIDNANSLVNKLCNAGSKISCQSILDSPAAKITPWFSWSDAGFIYFFGSFLGLLFSLIDSRSLSNYWTIQLVFSSIAIVFSSYSMYYQAIIAKMWCRFCLGVVTVFALEATLSLYAYSIFDTSFNIKCLLHFTIGFLLSTGFLLLYKTTSIKANQSKSLKRELTKLKNNPLIFEALMAGQKQMPEIPTDMPVITIGNINAEHKITMVSNPLCSPCAQMHARVEKVLKKNENLKVEIVFISTTHEKDSGGCFVRKLFSLPENMRFGALHNWFNRNDKKFEKWNTSYLEFASGNENNKIQAQHLNWTDSAEVQATPTLFFNGKMIPSMIKLEDLAFQVFAVST